jgi:hypothetical protein
MVGAMKRSRAALILLLGLALAGLVRADGTEGELRVFLILTQSTGPEMLNKIVGDIGSSAPTLETWGRKSTLIKKLPPDAYTVYVKNVEVCAFKDCTPCPEQSRDVNIIAKKTSDLIFRWTAKYDREVKKWSCW